jgi:hypothetical protein
LQREEGNFRYLMKDNLEFLRGIDVIIGILLMKLLLFTIKHNGR